MKEIIILMDNLVLHQSFFFKWRKIPASESLLMNFDEKEQSLIVHK